MFILTLLAIVSAGNSIMIHEHMTPEEMYATFQNDQGPLPEYEVVPVFHSRKQEKNDWHLAVKMNVFEREINLYLEPNDGVLAHSSTPVWTVSVKEEFPRELAYERVKEPFAKIGRAYQDRKNGSAIVAYEEKNGETLLLGNLHKDFVIRPLSNRLHEIVLQDNKTSSQTLPNFESDFRQTRHHVVFKKQESSDDHKLKIIERDPSKKNARDRFKRNIPNVVYPEILVIVDYSLFSVLNKNIEDSTRYVLALWNAVDLRYRLLSEPEIRLNIAGIIISLTEGGTSYIDDNRRRNTQLDADNALHDMSIFFYKESSIFDFSSYDMAIAMTHLDMCNVVFNDICDTTTLGYAYEWGACNRSHVDKNTEAVGLIEDNGGFAGIITAAHEIAHLMGVSHDGFEESPDCPIFGGFIMSSILNPGENLFSWSSCSLKHLHEFFSSEESACLFNEPVYNHSLDRILPGKLLTIDEQCEKISGTRACFHDERVCVELSCYIPGMGELCRAITSAAEGSSCGNEKHCINGHCVDSNATFVPYASSTETHPVNSPVDDNVFFRPRPIFVPSDEADEQSL